MIIITHNTYDVIHTCCHPTQVQCTRQDPMARYIIQNFFCFIYLASIFLSFRFVFLRAYVHAFSPSLSLRVYKYTRQSFLKPVISQSIKSCQKPEFFREFHYEVFNNNNNYYYYFTRTSLSYFCRALRPTLRFLYYIINGQHHDMLCMQIQPEWRVFIINDFREKQLL